MTMLGLCAGLTSMRFAVDARWGSAAVALVVAACIDGLDGRIARLLKATSRFGAEFDSLADFLLLRRGPRVHPLSVVAAFRGRLWLRPVPDVRRVHGAAAGAIQLDAGCGAPPAYAQSFFTGVPAPAGAGLVLFPLFAGLEANQWGWPYLYNVVHNPAFCAVVLVGCATLLVSTLPVWSFKNFKIPATYVLPILLGTGLFAAVLVADPWAALAPAG